jgi:hypothetical protein
MKNEQLELTAYIEHEKMIVNFPAYNHWIKQPKNFIYNQLIELGCEIVTEDGDYLVTAVPDHWYFISKGEKYLEIYGDKEHTQWIGVIKEHFATSQMITIIGDRK